jgi:hypothetical protein
MGPKPTELPDWPDGYERPDYMKEMEEYKTARVQADEEVDDVEHHPAARVETPPIMPKQVADISVPLSRAALKSAMKSVPTANMGTKGMRMKTPLILRSSTGHVNFPLNSKTDLKNAIIAQIIFGPPRAYDTSFENSIIK